MTDTLKFRVYGLARQELGEGGPQFTAYPTASVSTRRLEMALALEGQKRIRVGLTHTGAKWE